jgi:hypothetical protein
MLLFAVRRRRDLLSGRSVLDRVSLGVAQMPIAEGAEGQ